MKWNVDNWGQSFHILENTKAKMVTQVSVADFVLKRRGVHRNRSRDQKCFLAEGSSNLSSVGQQRKPSFFFFLESAGLREKERGATNGFEQQYMKGLSKATKIIGNKNTQADTLRIEMNSNSQQTTTTTSPCMLIDIKETIRTAKLSPSPFPPIR